MSVRLTGVWCGLAYSLNDITSLGSNVFTVNIMFKDVVRDAAQLGPFGYRPSEHGYAVPENAHLGVEIWAIAGGDEGGI